MLKTTSLLAFAELASASWTEHRAEAEPSALLISMIVQSELSSCGNVLARGIWLSLHGIEMGF